jgi:hypothetical protein
MDIPIKYLSWKDVAALVLISQKGASHREKHLLEELLEYLRGLITMQNQSSNWVFIVSLGSNTPDWSTISWIDVVEKKSLYFHPVGNGWPKEPPNYIAFRYNGQLQSIYHIESYEIVENINNHIPEMSPGIWEPHFLYKLGPAIKPNKTVKTGNIYRNGRVWCMFDTLSDTTTYFFS